MKAKLAKILIEKNIIRKETVFEALYNSKGISCQLDTSVKGSFKLVGAQSIGDWVFFDTIGPDTTTQTRIRCDSVISLDGMSVRRVAESHLLTLEGEPIIPKRGRRFKLPYGFDYDDYDEDEVVVIDEEE